MAGVTATGFEAKTIDEIRAAIHQRIADAPELGPHLDVSDHSALGQLTGIMAGLFGELWELAQIVFASQDPDAATDYALTVLASLTGTARRGETRTRVAVTLNIDAGETVPAGSRASVSGRPDIVCELEADVTNPGGSSADLPGVMLAVTPGPVAINAGTLTVIDTPVGGWNSVTNALDGITGRAEDNDIVLRQRREDQLALRGGSTIRAICADLLDSDAHPELDGIDTVIGLENPGEATDSNGVPPHSFEIVVDDGDPSSVDDDAIAQTIWDTKPAGIATFGDTTGTATDENGDTHAIRFSRREGVNIYVNYSLTTDDDFPSNGHDLVTAAIVALGDGLRIGDDVIYQRLRAAPFSVAGVLDVPTFAIGTTPGPAGTSNIPIAARARALFDTGRVTH
jgi:hypothetical protein